ncbi:hypothetical protein COV17_00770 [Candidatus Woesearchaeota archaeon CG10_big_fil_rev_8_21_14_0_10_36_11]|nr:MAG: hypothetical protein COV17_00770 [Candidatus Woesearchaeota archaeon CG10_big_fil_rev_8_21_14_0_10_36_11]
MVKRVESPSSINTFKQCKRKYYYSYIEKLPSVPNIHQVRGNMVHSVLENFYDVDTTGFTEENYPLKCKEIIQTLALHYWKQYEPKLKELHLSKDNEMFYFEESMLMIMNWVNHFIDDMRKVMEKHNISCQEAFNKLTPIREQKFMSEKHSIRGFIDAVHHIDDEVHIIDYKTNAQFEMKESIKLQLAIYSLLYEELHGKMPHKVGIFFLRNKLKIMNVDKELIQLAKREIELIHAHTSLTEQKKDYPRTITGLCKWSTGKCDYYDTCEPHSTT